MKENLRSIFLCILFLATGSGFCNAQYVTIWDREVKAIRDNVIPDFTLPYGDYTQYVPGVSVFALKCAGVESRSEWGRFLASAGTSAAISSIVSLSGKLVVGRLRPNKVNTQSFPSGHSTLAFTSAAILSKEYGWRSPWYSIGGYSFAMITATQRVISNWHWMSDTFCGALLGIAGVELGYRINDLLWRGRNGICKAYVIVEYDYEPHSYELEWIYGRRFPIAGLFYPSEDMLSDENFGESPFCYPTSGALAAIQYEHPLNILKSRQSSSGIITRLSASSLSHNNKDRLAPKGAQEKNNSSFNIYGLNAGGFYRYTFNRHFELEGYAMLGCAFRDMKRKASPDSIVGISANLLTTGSNTFKIKGFAEIESFRFAPGASMFSCATLGFAAGFWWD